MANDQEILNQLKKGVNVTSTQPGEDTAANRVLIETRWSTGSIAVNGTLSIVASANATASRVLGNITIGMYSCPTLTFYDNGSGASGTILALFNAGAPINTYLINRIALNGITAWITAGIATQVSVGYR